MKTGRLTIVLSVVLMLSGCNASSREREPLKEGLWIFSNGHIFAGVYHVFILRDDLCVVQVADFPGFGNRRFYLRQKLPVAVMDEVKHWCVAKGDVKPPFIPEQDVVYRTFVKEDSKENREDVCFDGSKEPIRQFLANLQQATHKPEYQIEELPEWVTANPALMHDLGFREPAQQASTDGIAENSGAGNASPGSDE